MDPERTFLRLARLTFARLLAPRFRRALEKLCLFNALMLLSLLVIMHVNFVSQPGCSAKFAQNDTAEAQLIQVKITGSWNSLVDSTLRSWAQGKAKVLYVNGKLKFADEFEDGQVKRILSNPMGKIKGEVEDDKVAHEISSDDGRAGRSFAAPRRGSLGTSLAHYLTRWSNYCRQVWRLAGWEPFAATPKVEQGAAAWNQLDSVSVEQMDKESTLYDPIYLYSIEKGYLILSEAAKSKHNIRTVNISISAHDECFGNRWLQLLIDNFVGYDTILMNSLLSRRQRGYLYNYQTKELYNLNYIQQSGGVLQDYVVLKFGILIMSLFVFFTTTMSVSFTLRETRLRMLKFTVQLHHHARHRLPTFRLTFFHVFESLVFVPIMIGILFFLFEFFDDQLLAFMVLTLVWLCELFTIISVRTPVSRKYFPRFFFLYFLAFHIYFFSYTYGFSYLAFSATVAFMQHLVLYFWNRFEAPALLTYLRGRALLQQQGFHVTSILTSILTSAVQVARINLMDTTLPETSVNDNSLRTEEAPVESRDGSRPILGATFGIAGDAGITSTESSRLHGPNRSVTGTNSNESTQTSSEGITSSGIHSIAAPLTVIQSVFPSWIVRSSGGLVSLLSVRPAVQEDNSDAPNSDGGGVSQTITDESGLRHRHAFGTENNEIR